MIRKKVRMQFWVWILFLGMSGCMSQCNPFDAPMNEEETLDAYLQAVFNFSSLSDKQKIVDLTTGDLRSSIEAADDKTIEDAYLNRKYELSSYQVISKKVLTPRETQIRYKLVLRDTFRQEGEENLEDGMIPTVTVENTVKMLKKNDRWYLEDVKDKNTSFHFPVPYPETEIKASPDNNAPETLEEDLSIDQDEEENTEE